MKIAKRSEKCLADLNPGDVFCLDTDGEYYMASNQKRLDGKSQMMIINCGNGITCWQPNEVIVVNYPDAMLMPEGVV